MHCYQILAISSQWKQILLETCGQIHTWHDNNTEDSIYCATESSPNRYRTVQGGHWSLKQANLLGPQVCLYHSSPFINPSTQPKTWHWFYSPVNIVVVYMHVDGHLNQHRVTTIDWGYTLPLVSQTAYKLDIKLNAQVSINFFPELNG